ncbi:MAG: periplasmic heavy metal sensor [Candidatus Acidiferrales bacterium]
MQFRSKAALAVLALALSCTPALAQGDPQDSPPQQQGPRDGFAGRGPMGNMRNMGPGDDGRGGWGHGHMRGGLARGARMDGGFGRGRMGRRGGFGMGQREFGLSPALRDPDIRKQVGITDDQFAKMRQQESDFRKTEIRDRADLQVKRIDLRDLLSADKPDRAAIDSKLQEISAAQLALEKAAVDYRLDMRDAITPAQRDKLRQLMKDRWQRGGSGPGRPGGPQAMGRRGQRGRGGPATAPAPQANPQPNN